MVIDLVMLEISLSNVMGKNVHYSEKSLGPEVKNVLDQIDSYQFSKRNISMNTILAGHKKKEAIRWFRSIMCIIKQSL